MIPGFFNRKSIPHASSNMDMNQRNKDAHPPYFDVLGLGCACLDFLGIVPKMPGLDDEISMISSSQQGGGEVATALVALSKLGASTAYLGKVGDDPAGMMIRQELNQYGVDTRYIQIDPKATSITSMVIIDETSGKRTILAGAHDQCELESSEIPKAPFNTIRYLHLDGSSRPAALLAAAMAQKTKVKVVMDADVLAFDKDIDYLLKMTDILIASEGFARLYTGLSKPEEMIERLCVFDAEIVAITLGEKGSICFTDDRMIYTPAFPVDVIDTTGAGDVFHGAFIYGLLKDWAVEKTAEFASAVAAMKCTRLGGRLGIPGLDEAMNFLFTHNAQHFLIDEEGKIISNP